MSSRVLRTVLAVSIVLNLAAVYVGLKALEYRSHINDYLFKYHEVVEEFSARDVHLAENVPLNSDTTIPRRVVFVGTQVTVNWPLEASFPDLETINRGVVGQRLAGFPLRFYSDVIELAPQVVVIEISSFQFRAPYSIQENAEWTETMIDLAIHNGILPVVPTIIPPRSGTELEEFEDYRIADTVWVYNSWLREKLAGRGLPICDFARVLSDSTGGLSVDYSTTAVDINTSGYAVMTEELKRVLLVHKIGLETAESETTAD